MNLTNSIMTAVLFLTFFSPFVVYYGVKQAKNKDYNTHRKTQNHTYIICVLGVLSLEVLIRYSGGSGSLASESIYYGHTFFTIILVSHIFIAVLTYLLWTILIIYSNRKFQKSLPGTFSKNHKKMGLIIFGGLIYTAITALLVYLMSLSLI